MMYLSRQQRKEREEQLAAEEAARIAKIEQDRISEEMRIKNERIAESPYYFEVLHSPRSRPYPDGRRQYWYYILDKRKPVQRFGGNYEYAAHPSGDYVYSEVNTDTRENIEKQAIEYILELLDEQEEDRRAMSND